ncbi:hypothetical protein BpHYR1_047431 [Brachionus plicatilis]|uniref:Uncharacterized protein n=1 Tax=Brachionus plicatilis TaxID=10195 RepID=A0A3M7P382_BRAPC|nr:hypothetical protein BpHYR1_047431 [Brachionus plicatilis]
MDLFYVWIYPGKIKLFSYFNLSIIICLSPDGKNSFYKQIKSELTRHHFNHDDKTNVCCIYTQQKKI